MEEHSLGYVQREEDSPADSANGGSGCGSDVECAMFRFEDLLADENGDYAAEGRQRRGFHTKDLQGNDPLHICGDGREAASRVLGLDNGVIRWRGGRDSGWGNVSFLDVGLPFACEKFSGDGAGQ